MEVWEDLSELVLSEQSPNTQEESVCSISQTNTTMEPFVMERLAGLLLLGQALRKPEASSWHLHMLAGPRWACQDGGCESHESKGRHLT